MAKFSRFQNLETPRQPRKEEGSAREHGRFEALESSRPEAPNAEPPKVSEGALARFRPNEAEEKARFQPTPLERLPELELDERRGAQDSFIRCRTCNGDNSVHAQFCVQCGERLDTVDQAAFNAQFREKLRADAAASEAAAEEDGVVPPLSAPPAPAPAAWVEQMSAERMRHAGLNAEETIPEWMVPFWPRYAPIGAPEDGKLVPVERMLARVGAVLLGALTVFVFFASLKLRFGRSPLVAVLGYGTYWLWNFGFSRPRLWD